MVTEGTERKGMEQIKKIVDSLGADSYIKRRFDGVEMLRECQRTMASPSA